jgi:hypothetical protein
LSRDHRGDGAAVSTIRLTREMEASSSRYSPRDDIALLELETAIEGPSVSIADTESAEPKSLIRYESSGSEPNPANSVRVEVLNIEVRAIDGPLIFARPAIREGDSGAPVVDATGRLVALAVGVTARNSAGLSVLMRVTRSQGL